jgi:hypothetical protein
MKKSMYILFAMVLIFAAGTTYAAQVQLLGPTEVNPADGTFSFDIVISDVGSLDNWDAWNLSFVMIGGLNAVFSGFDDTVVGNSDYVFFGDSLFYQWVFLTDFTAFGGGLTVSGNGVEAEVGDLIATIIIDISDDMFYELYTVTLDRADQNFYLDSDLNLELIALFEGKYEFRVVPDPGTALEGISIFFEESVTDETLAGDGPGESADGRLNALRKMLEMAGDLISIDIEASCVQLHAALERCDGESPPPDFVTGSAAIELNNMIEELMEELGCE